MRLITFIAFISFLYSQKYNFIDESKNQNLIFHHDHGGSGQRYYIETIGPGVCIFDYDNDKDLDIYFCQGSALPGWEKNINLENKLFRNDNGKWTDVTSNAGVGDTSYSFGCACADIDNDGDADLYVTNLGNDILYRNNGDGTFNNITDKANIKNQKWGSSAAFFDMDNDGLLDIYVANYVEFSIDNNPWCGDRRIDLRDYCQPDWFSGENDYLLKNQGNCKFQDVSVLSGINRFKGKGLGVIPADFDKDGDLDIYVANDKVMNHYYVNDGKGKFEENAMFSGVGFNHKGLAEAGMGVDIGDVNGDGWQDIFVTNFSGESNTVYINNKNGFFIDKTTATRLTQPSWNYVGFGTKLLDLNYDGWQDIFVVNGHVAANINHVYKDYTYPQPKQIFINSQDGTFKEVTIDNIGDAKQPSVGRGAAFGDLDNDGDIDVVIANNNGPANLLIRDGAPQKTWVGFYLIGNKSNRDAIGASVQIRIKKTEQVKIVNTSGSYLSSNDKRLIFGLNGNLKVDRVRIKWPGGTIDQFFDLKSNYYYQIIEGGRISTLYQ